MKRCRNRQDHSTLGAPRLAALAGTFDGGFTTGDYCLPWRVKVYGRDNLTIADLGLCFNACFTDFFVIQIKNGCHRPGADRDRFLHSRCAQPNQRNSILEIDNPRRNQSGILTQTVSGDDSRSPPAFIKPQAIGSNSRRQHQWLRIHCLCQ